MSESSSPWANTIGLIVENGARIASRPGQRSEFFCRCRLTAPSQGACSGTAHRNGGLTSSAPLVLQCGVTGNGAGGEISSYATQLQPTAGWWHHRGPELAKHSRGLESLRRQRPHGRIQAEDVERSGQPARRDPEVSEGSSPTHCHRCAGSTEASRRGSGAWQPRARPSASPARHVASNPCSRAVSSAHGASLTVPGFTSATRHTSLRASY